MVDIAMRVVARMGGLGLVLVLDDLDVLGMVDILFFEIH